MPPWLLVLVVAASASLPASAYPEFQKFIQTHSGRGVNCSFCHSNPDGPEGMKSGQIGSLNPEELKQLNAARSAFEPGQAVKSPILNAFGNAIIERIGKKAVLTLRANPELLAPKITGHDLDDDGIDDAEELLDGTHPLDPNHGDPWKLGWVNLQRHAVDLLLLALATALGIYGLGHVLRWFAHSAEAALRHDPKTSPKGKK